MKRLAILAILAILAVVSAQATEWDKIPIDLYVGPTASGAAAASGIIRIPQPAQIESVHIIESINVGADDDGLIVGLYLNDALIGSIGSSTALTANTAQAITPTTYNLVAGDILQARASKAGVGTVTEDLTVSLSLFNTTSRR